MKTNVSNHLIIDKTFQGAYILSKFKGSDLVKMQYMGYSLKEAKSLFTEYFNNY